MNTSSKLAIAASIGLIVSFLLPWVQIIGFAASGYNLSQLGSYGNYAWIPLIIGVLALAINASPQAPQRAKNAVSVLGAMIVAGGMAYVLAQIGEQAGEGMWHAMGIGVYVLFGAAGVLFISGCLNTQAVENAGAAKVFDPSDDTFEAFHAEKIAQDSAFKSFRKQELLEDYYRWREARKAAKPPQIARQSTTDVLSELKRLLDASLISKTEYESKKQEILQRL